VIWCCLKAQRFLLIDSLFIVIQMRKRCSHGAHDCVRCARPSPCAATAGHGCMLEFMGAILGHDSYLHGHHRLALVHAETETENMQKIRTQGLSNSFHPWLGTLLPWRRTQPLSPCTAHRSWTHGFNLLILGEMELGVGGELPWQCFSRMCCLMWLTTGWPRNVKRGGPRRGVLCIAGGLSQGSLVKINIIIKVT
jgi:hypothetical protein